METGVLPGPSTSPQLRLETTATRKTGMGHWKNKVVMITGGSRGLGRALALAFAEAGARVVIAARDADTLREVAGQLVKAGGLVTGVVTDVTRQESVEHLIAETLRLHGRLDVLVNCVGRSDRGELLHTSVEQMRDLWELNFLAPARCTAAAAPHLIESQGHVINIGSLAAKVASRFLGGYATSKFPLDAYSQQLRLEIGPKGVKVLLVCTGPIRRVDAGSRYASRSEGLPDSAAKPGAGVKLNALDPDALSRQILRAAERGKAELIVPNHARLLFALCRLFPKLGDRIIRKMT